MSTDQLEPTTRKLLSYEDLDIYAVLVRMKERFEHKNEQTKHELMAHPQFLRAIFQAQYLFGIAYIPDQQSST